MAKINVITVDLGDPIESIIAEDVRQLSEETLENIKAAANDKVRGPIRTDPETLATEAAYNLLLEAVVTGEQIEISRLLEASSPAVTNPSALMMRMKGLLRQKGNDYILRRATRAGKPVYRLAPYNLETADDGISTTTS
jgi:hypothetical protein